MINGLSFRPRPIDVNKHIPIVRKDLDGEDDEQSSKLSRSLPLMPSGMDSQDEEESHIQVVIKHPPNKLVDKSAIPTPKIKIVPHYDNTSNPKPFHRPQGYICFQDPSQEEWFERVLYDLDDDDSKFLRQLNGSKRTLTENNFELIIDRCEKEASKMIPKLPTLATLEKLLPQIKSNILEAVYNYWTKKRKKNNGKPLMFEFLGPPDPSEDSPFAPFHKRDEKPRVRRRNDLSAFHKMRHLRQEMEKARTLLEMIKRREKMKKEVLEVKEQIFEAQCLSIQEEEQKAKTSPPKKRKSSTTNTKKRPASRSPSPSPNNNNNNNNNNYKSPKKKKTEPKQKRTTRITKKKKSPATRRARRR